MQDYSELASDLVKRAVARGADQAEVFITQGRELSLEVRLGRISRLEEARPERLGLRVFRRGSTSLSYASHLTSAVLEQVLNDALSSLNLTDPDPCNRLAEAEELGACPGDLELVDDALAGLSTDDKLERVARMEEAGLASDPRVNNTNGAWWNDAHSLTTVANSHGFVGRYAQTQVSQGIALVGEEGGVKQADRWSSTAHHLTDLAAPEAIGREAARRVIRKLGGGPIPTQTVDVVLDPQMGSDFLQILIQALQGPAIWRRNSFLVDRLGDVLAHPRFRVVDDATRPRGLASRPFDGEGVRSRRVDILREGRLEGYLCDTYSAVKLDRPVTGSALRRHSSPPSVGASNFYLEPGDISPEDIIRGVKRGLYVTNLYWVGINQATGDYSRAAEGVWIEDGELTRPVQEVTVAGNVLEMLPRIEVIGSDLTFLTSVGSPTFLVPGMVISGR